MSPHNNIISVQGREVVGVRTGLGGVLQVWHSWTDGAAPQHSPGVLFCYAVSPVR